LLLEADGDSTIRSAQNKTPLQIASERLVDAEEELPEIQARYSEIAGDRQQDDEEVEGLEYRIEYLRLECAKLRKTVALLQGVPAKLLGVMATLRDMEPLAPRYSHADSVAG